MQNWLGEEKEEEEEEKDDKLWPANKSCTA